MVVNTARLGVFTCKDMVEHLGVQPTIGKIGRIWFQIRYMSKAAYHPEMWTLQTHGDTDDKVGTN